MAEQIPKSPIAPVEADPLSVITAPVPTVPGELDNSAGASTAEIPILPSEATQQTPELSAHDAKVQRVGNEVGALSIFNLVRAPYDRAALAVNGLRRAVTAHRVKTAEERLATPKSFKEAAQSALDHRGMKARFRPTTNQQHGAHLDAWQIKRRADRRKGLQNSLASVYGRKVPAKGGDVYYGVRVDEELRKYYGMPVDTDDPYKRALPPSPDLAPAYDKAKDSWNDIGTPQYFARINSTNMTPKDRRAAVSAGHQFNELERKRQEKLGVLKSVASGKHRSVRVAELGKDRDQKRVKSGRAKLRRLNKARTARVRAMKAR